MKRKLSKKVGIPLCVFWLVAAMAIWFVPYKLSGNAFVDSTATQLLVKIIATFAGVFGFLDTIIWMKKKDDSNA